MRVGSVYRISGSLVNDDQLGAVARLGLRTLVDLRAPDEDRDALIDFTAKHTIAYRHLPIHVARREDLAAVAVSPRDARALMGRIYLEMVRDHGPTLAAAIAALNSSLPAGFGCAAGKDRTGVLSAILQRAMGVAEETVIAEYVRCAPDPALVRVRLAQLLPAGAALGRGLDVLIAPDPDALRGALHYVENAHGGIDGYLRGMGLGDGVLDRLRASLLVAVEPGYDVRRAADQARDVG
jgi:hypothetical protein